MVDVDTGQEDLLTRILELEKAGEINKAVELIGQRESRQEQLALLKKLGSHTIGEFDRARNRTRDFARDLGLPRDLDFVYDFSRDLALNRALVLAIVSALDRDPSLSLDLAGYLDLDFDRALNHALDRALVDLDHAIDQDRIRATFSQLINYLDLDRIQRLTTIIASVLRLSPQTQHPVANTTTSAILSGIDFLTPERLTSYLSPYLQALADLERVIHQLTNAALEQPRITLISQNSPIGFQMSGVGNAITAVRDIVVPWRRQHAKHMAELAEKEKQIGIARLQAEIMEVRARAAQTRTKTKRSEAKEEGLRLENEEKRLELEEKRLALEKTRLDIHRAKIDLALSIIERFAPDLPEKERITYVSQMLKSLSTLVESPLEISVGQQ